MQFKDITSYELTLRDLQNLPLTDFKQNILFGIQGLFLRNPALFKSIYLELLALYVPNTFIEENQNAFTVSTLKNIFPYYRSILTEIIKIAAFERTIAQFISYRPTLTYMDFYFD